MLLEKLLDTIDYQTSPEFQNIEINNIKFDSKKCQQNDLFVAIQGSTVDGHKFIPHAISRKASAIICQQWPKKLLSQVQYIKVSCTKEALGILAHNFYGKPSRELDLVGITGTNGKTTVSNLLYQLYQSSGQKSGLISTIDIRNQDQVFKATLTTPNPLEINYHLRKMVDSGVQQCFMEVSSHGIQQKRIKGLNFIGGVFTNLSQDHLDYHRTYQNYRDTKKSFFDALASTSFAITNQDDKNGYFMLQNTTSNSHTYGVYSNADYKGKILERRLDGYLIEIDGVDFWTHLGGDFNLYNLLATYATALTMGYPREKLHQDLSKLQAIEGRFQCIKTSNGIVIIDYAHTPNALKNVLNSINQLRTPQQKVITVIGCGGNRDSSKRPLMGKIAAKNSHQVIVTSDNPRNESPQLIMEQMIQGIKCQKDKSKVLTESDRRLAIIKANQLATVGDIVLIAGKGHEKFQEINQKQIPFDDVAIAQEVFQ
ncbi:MAG: UDP-N-acetylmuramoyl-L-alanyl-D-glutamate--2,6-diaminopimelate ligase [Flavobacteriaceae bacterium]|nr:UDP-N-acetylmuramoyl-L-alanyl-D-glutamate--2,6-diaminopimelate ligase [Flavobacteriaceae bacterium]MCY4268194.1 UDP-N-acetylmuramoyl-L-alanyl-D-glutamate--2,6-diaminopimelate ligase [Flavobacteriaceae bacterium]MCY4300091.1 UDP-N-acetylmuramoyl-L-alanyl-D-glutamate--2,6-diaminopimelate ligase [Flavobacteriaceae bacterium]